MDINTRAQLASYQLVRLAKEQYEIQVRIMELENLENTKTEQIKFLNDRLEFVVLDLKKFVDCLLTGISIEKEMAGK